MLNQIYANVIGCPILIPDGAPAGLGSCIFASLAAGVYESIEEAQNALCLPMRVVRPEKTSVELYNRMFSIYKKLYFGFGRGDTINIGDVLPQLRMMRRVDSNPS